MSILYKDNKQKTFNYYESKIKYRVLYRNCLKIDTNGLSCMDY